MQPNIGRVYGDSVEIASSTNAWGIGLRCLGTKLASRTTGETCFLLVIPVHLQPRIENSASGLATISASDSSILNENRIQPSFLNAMPRASWVNTWKPRIRPLES